MTRAEEIGRAVIAQAIAEGVDPMLWAIRRASTVSLVEDLERLGRLVGPGNAIAPIVDELEGEILEILGEDPSSSGELCELIEAEAGEIRAALERLVESGRIRGTPLTREGWAARTWRLADDE